MHGSGCRYHGARRAAHSAAARDVDDIVRHADFLEDARAACQILAAERAVSRPAPVTRVSVEEGLDVTRQLGRWRRSLQRVSRQDRVDIALRAVRRLNSYLGGHQKPLHASFADGHAFLATLPEIKRDFNGHIFSNTEAAPWWNKL